MALALSDFEMSCVTDLGLWATCELLAYCLKRGCEMGKLVRFGGGSLLPSGWGTDASDLSLLGGSVSDCDTLADRADHADLVSPVDQTNDQTVLIHFFKDSARYF